MTDQPIRLTLTLPEAAMLWRLALEGYNSERAVSAPDQGVADDVLLKIARCAP